MLKLFQKLPTCLLLKRRPSRLQQICLRSTSAHTQLRDNEHVKDFKEMPGPGGIYNIPKLGPAFLFKPFTKYTVQTVHDMLDELHDKYGKTFRMELLGQTLITEDPDVIETIFRSEGHFPRRPDLKILDVFCERNNRSRGMALLNGQDWHRQRSATQKHMLKPNSASVYVSEQAGVANDLITRMSTMSYTPEQFREELFQYATESIGVVTFNKRLGFMDPKGSTLSPENARFLEGIKTFFIALMQDFGSQIYKWIPTKYYRDFEKSTNYLYSYGQRCIDDSIAATAQELKDGTFDPKKPNLIIQLQSSPNMSDENVNVTLLDLLLAGTDSTAKNMETFLLNLALNPDKQEKLYEEIRGVIGPKGHELTAEHMKEMTYFNACIKESFRIRFPVASGSMRTLAEDLVIGGYSIPKGTNAMFNNRRVVLNSEYFESPEKFLPERWLRNRDTGKRSTEYPAFGLLPFGFGRRNCVGRRFAEQELWLGVTKIIQNFKISVPGEDKDYKTVYTIFVHNEKPVEFTWVPR